MTYEEAHEELADAYAETILAESKDEAAALAWMVYWHGMRAFTVAERAAVERLAARGLVRLWYNYHGEVIRAQAYPLGYRVAKRMPHPCVDGAWSDTLSRLP